MCGIWRGGLCEHRSMRRVVGAAMADGRRALGAVFAHDGQRVCVCVWKMDNGARVPSECRVLEGWECGTNRGDPAAVLCCSSRCCLQEHTNAWVGSEDGGGWGVEQGGQASEGW